MVLFTSTMMLTLPCGILFVVSWLFGILSLHSFIVIYGLPGEMRWLPSMRANGGSAPVRVGVGPLSALRSAVHPSGGAGVVGAPWGALVASPGAGLGTPLRQRPSTGRPRAPLLGCTAPTTSRTLVPVILVPDFRSLPRSGAPPPATSLASGGWLVAKIFLRSRGR